jgi:signal transduction histidine kinase
VGNGWSFIPGQTDPQMNPLTISINTTTTQLTGNDQIVKDPIPFASVLAHELRNPLTNINLSIQMLRSRLKDQDLDIFMDIIVRSSMRINDLVNDILKPVPQQETAAKEYSVHQLLDEVIEMNRDRIVLKNISVRRVYAKQDFKIVFDGAKIKIALTNIIINAIDAMRATGGKLKLCTELIAGRFVVSIQDNGCGISKENLPFIFKPFFTNKRGGLGIGLAATYEILQSNEIGVNVESVRGRGTRFNLLFEKSQIINEKINIKIPWDRICLDKILAGIACEA